MMPTTKPKPPMTSPPTGGAAAPRATRRSSTRHWSFLAGALLLALGSVIAGAAPAVAQTAGAVTDYASYPAPLPAGCPDGKASLVDVRFSNGRGGDTADLRQLDVGDGDTLTMSWQDFHGSCKTAGGGPAVDVTMAAYDAGSATFDPSIDQRLLPGWVTCGPSTSPCAPADGRYQLSITMPGIDVTCQVQAGAILGLPLEVVGPNGSYYNSVIRRDAKANMLIDATNFETPGCVSGTTTSVPATTTSALPSSTTTAPVADTTASTAGAPAAVSAESAELPFTGRSVGTQVWAGLLLALTGAGLVAYGVTVDRRRASARH
jgi:hypothetical protein